MGFNRLSFRFEAGDDNLRGRLDVGFNAAVVYFRGGFGTIE
jgi:hypothetical protein